MGSKKKVTRERKTVVVSAKITQSLREELYKKRINVSATIRESLKEAVNE